MQDVYNITVLLNINNLNVTTTYYVLQNYIQVDRLF